jgi:hypothetical protein
MGYERTAYGHYTIGDIIMNPEIKEGSLSVGEESHQFLEALVVSDGFSELLQPFESIVEAFRYAFSLGFLNGQKGVREGAASTISPRQFISRDYYDLLEEEALSSSKSIGMLISEYAEGGIVLIRNLMPETVISAIDI